ncbi:MAG: hypothetical protein AB7H77_12530 [Bdellovibrionales bacterium]
MRTRSAVPVEELALKQAARDKFAEFFPEVRSYDSLRITGLLQAGKHCE